MIRYAALCLMLAGPAAALDLSLPATAQQTVERQTAADVYQAPVGAFSDGAVPHTTIEGDVYRAAWRINSAGLTPLQVMRPLRAQVEDAGYEIVLDCDSAACGGFDFRFGTEVLLGPHMYVNIRDYHFVTGVRRAEGMVEDAVTLLASSSASAAYLQIIRADTSVTPSALSVVMEDDVALNDNGRTAEALETRLLADGHVVLDDLDFDVGTTDLGEGPFASLVWLSAFLQSRPDQRVALVGHTDTVGGLEGNITLSRQRALAVRQRLIDTYKISAAQMDAEGMGYLSPLASNLTPEGREQNRRVEVILLSAP